MALAFKGPLAADPLFHLSQFRGAEFKNPAAVKTSQMAVELPAENPFIMHVTVSQKNLGQKTGSNHQRNGPVDGGFGDRSLGPQMKEELVNIKMIMIFQDGLRNGFSFFGYPVAPGLEKTAESVHLSREIGDCFGKGAEFFFTHGTSPGKSGPNNKCKNYKQLIYPKCPPDPSLLKNNFITPYFNITVFG
jgi:hypothetical protein